MAESYVLRIIGNLLVTGRIDRTEASIDETDLKTNTAIPRSKLAQDTFQPYVIDPTMLRLHDSFTALLPQAAASDALAVIEGTFGTDMPTVQTSDSKATSVTQRCRFLFTLPPEYDAGQSIRVRVRGGMITTVSDTSATVDVECHAHDDDGAVGSDLCTDAAQSMNALAKANFDFTITETGLAAGDTLDVRITIAIVDSATGTEVIGELSKIEVDIDIKG